MARERLSGDERELLYAIAQQATALAGGTMNTEAHDERELLAEIELQLRTLVESGSGDGANLQFITGTENPPTAAPADLNKPAQYYNTSNKFYWNWNIGTQTWIPQPKVYRALLSQTGTSAPSAIVVENTIGGTVVWTRGNVGMYIGTLAGAFPNGKALMRAGVPADESFPFAIGFYRIDVNVVMLSVQSLEFAYGNGLYADNWTVLPVEILVYP